MQEQKKIYSLSISKSYLSRMLRFSNFLTISKTLNQIFGFRISETGKYYIYLYVYILLKGMYSEARLRTFIIDIVSSILLKVLQIKEIIFFLNGS